MIAFALWLKYDLIFPTVTIFRFTLTINAFGCNNFVSELLRLGEFANHRFFETGKSPFPASRPINLRPGEGLRRAFADYELRLSFQFQSRFCGERCLTFVKGDEIDRAYHHRRRDMKNVQAAGESDGRVFCGEFFPLMKNIGKIVNWFFQTPRIDVRLRKSRNASFNSSIA